MKTVTVNEVRLFAVNAETGEREIIESLADAGDRRVFATVFVGDGFAVTSRISNDPIGALKLFGKTIEGRIMRVATEPWLFNDKTVNTKSVLVFEGETGAELVSRMKAPNGANLVPLTEASAVDAGADLI